MSEALERHLARVRAALDELASALARDAGAAEREGYRERLRSQLADVKRCAALVASQAPLREAAPASAVGASADLRRAIDQVGLAARAIAALLAAETAATELSELELARQLHRARRDQERLARYLERLIPKLARAAVRESVDEAELAARRAAVARPGDGNRSSDQAEGSPR
ncbi:hypothetical protein [Thermoleophilum album]|uniref:Uncharacterized protein n=1 Tax=Thermoleophilum album TaxID=29539 RepID=A0A1H6FZE6_THEAL|nr:hypothetical protein [Thermoleophilum album]SEH15383.1 hypothetical protein SAMN02745716_1932 [Thermoleophilum album]